MPIMFSCFTEERRGFGFNLDSGECGHAVENYGRWRRIGNASVVGYQGLLRYVRPVEVRSND